MGLCRDCKWWIEADSAEIAFGWRQDGWGRCRLSFSEGRTNYENSLAVAEDADSYHAWLKTKPDFGCVQFKARE